MSKSDLLRDIDLTPPIRNGEIVTGATLIQVSQLALTSPFAGDFQIVNNGRLIVGENPDVGARVIVANHGLFGWGSGGINTFGVYTTSIDGHNAGDWHAGNRAANYIAYDHVEGTLGLYSTAGAGFLADRDGSLRAGYGDGAHMLWNSANSSLEIRNGNDVKISLDDDGNAMFDGTVYAAGGRIYGDMQVDSVLRAGDVDGPAVYIGKFERYNDLSELVESSEIIATNADNLPWFHVVAGGDTAAGGWFQVGNPGDYQQRMTYDGSVLSLDGDITARSGTFAGDVTITTGSLIWGDGEGRADSTGMYINAYDLSVGPNDNKNYIRFVDADGETLSYFGTLFSALAGVSFSIVDLSGMALNAGNIHQAKSDTGQLSYVNMTALRNGAADFAAVECRYETDESTTITLTADTIDITGGVQLTTTTKTADYVATVADHVIVCNKATAMTITLPAATGSGQWFVISSIGAGAVTVDGNSSDTINGLTTQTIGQYDAMQVVDYAANAWVII